MIWAGCFDELGLARTAVTVRGEGDNPVSPDPAIRRLGIDHNKEAVDCAAALGATSLMGRSTQRSGILPELGQLSNSGAGLSRECRGGRVCSGKTDYSLSGVPPPLRPTSQHDRSGSAVRERCWGAECWHPLRHVPCHIEEPTSETRSTNMVRLSTMCISQKTTGAFRGRVLCAGMKPLRHFGT